MAKYRESKSKTGEYNCHITDVRLVELIKLVAKSKNIATQHYIEDKLRKNIIEDLREFDKDELLNLLVK